MGMMGGWERRKRENDWKEVEEEDQEEDQEEEEEQKFRYLVGLTTRCRTQAAKGTEA